MTRVGYGDLLKVPTLRSGAGVLPPPPVSDYWYYIDHTEPGTLFQDSAGTTPANIGDPVGRINDISASGWTGTQTTTSAKPTRDAGGITFDGTGDSFELTGMTSAATNYTFFVRMTVNFSTGTEQFLFDAQTGRFVVAHAGNPLQVKAGYYDGSWKNTTAAFTTGDRYLCWTLTSGASTIHRNGVSIFSSGSYTPIAIGGVVRIGCNNSGSQYFMAVTLQSLLVYRRALSQAERESLDAWTLSRHGALS